MRQRLQVVVPIVGFVLAGLALMDARDVQAPGAASRIELTVDASKAGPKIPQAPSGWR